MPMIESYATFLMRLLRGVSKKPFRYALFVSVLVPCGLSAQARKSLSIEFLGASTTLGVHYDTRFSSNTQWGGRIGIAYTNSSSQDFFESAPVKTTGWSIPIAVNYLIGTEKHHAEIGVGVNYGLYNCKYYSKDNNEFTKQRSGYFGFLDIGYRYQPDKGVVLRAGINPGVALGRQDQLGRYEHGVNRAAVIYPYISVGYSF